MKVNLLLYRKINFSPETIEVSVKIAENIEFVTVTLFATPTISD